jgi:type II secretory pathway component PulK
MGLIQVFKNKLIEMAREDIRRGNVAHTAADAAEGSQIPSRAKLIDSKGIALMMVIAAVSILSFLVTEFTYVAQLNQKLAYDELDQVKAHYLAKSGLKLSLLRLKAYRTVKKLLANQSGANAVPKSALDQIWAFPFLYPLPTNLPGISPSDKEAIQKFQSSSNLEGNYSAVITSESSRINLNMILAGFQGPASPTPSPSPSASASAKPTGLAPKPAANPTPSPSPSFDPEVARKSLQDYFQSILQNKYDKDPDFMSEYRDFRIEDFMDNLIAWADPTYERKQSGMDDAIPMKRAPFYSVTELHMLPGMDDQLYDLFSPNLTVSRTSGININSMGKGVLRALVPNLTDDDVKAFFEFRDSQEDDNTFKDADAFFKWLSENTDAYKGHDDLIQKLKDDLKKRNINLVTDESEFKITVQAHVNDSIQTLEAWVTLESDDKSSKSTTTSSKPNNATSSQSNSPTPQATPTGTPDAGLKINFMRFL